MFFVRCHLAVIQQLVLFVVCAGVTVVLESILSGAFVAHKVYLYILCKDSDFFLCVIAVDGYFFVGIVAFFCALFYVLFFV